MPVMCDKPHEKLSKYSKPNSAARALYQAGPNYETFSGDQQYWMKFYVIIFISSN
jgi:hypothetical protein